MGPGFPPTFDVVSCPLLTQTIRVGLSPLFDTIQPRGAISLIAHLLVFSEVFLIRLAPCPVAGINAFFAPPLFGREQIVRQTFKADVYLLFLDNVDLIAYDLAKVFVVGDCLNRTPRPVSHADMPRIGGDWGLETLYGHAIGF
jgi:hypothetical protein